MIGQIHARKMVNLLEVIEAFASRIKQRTVLLCKLQFGLVTCRYTQTANDECLMMVSRCLFYIGTGDLSRESEIPSYCDPAEA